MDNTIIKVDEIPRVEWRNERVMTTAQLAEFYETSADNIKMNFSNNRDRFVEGKHFFKLESDDLQNLRVKNLYPQISPMTRVLYLWTKHGAAHNKKARHMSELFLIAKQKALCYNVAVRNISARLFACIRFLNGDIVSDLRVKSKEDFLLWTTQSSRSTKSRVSSGAMNAS